MVRKVDPRFGYAGLATSLLGVLMVLVSQLYSYWTRSPALTPWILVAAMLYLFGGMATVAAFGYTRDTKAFLALRVMRLFFAAGVVVAIVRTIAA